MKPQSNHPRQNGFTLIEIITVVLIIGVILSFATLSVDRSSGRVAEQETKRLQGLLRFATEEAVIKGKKYALRMIATDAYVFEVYKENKWTKPDSDIYRPRELPAGLRAQLQIEGEPVDLNDKDTIVRIQIFPSGEMVPFYLTLKPEDGGAYSLCGNSNAEVVFVAPGQSIDEQTCEMAG